MSTTSGFLRLGAKAFLRKFPVNAITVPHVLHAPRADGDTGVATPSRVKGDSKNSLASIASISWKRRDGD